MSNQNPKSDEMLKSYVAQIASQGVAIFLQQKQESKGTRTSALRGVRRAATDEKYGAN